MDKNMKLKIKKNYNTVLNEVRKTLLLPNVYGVVTFFKQDSSTTYIVDKQSKKCRIIS
jgi:hypothetical protein